VGALDEQLKRIAGLKARGPGGSPARRAAPRANPIEAVTVSRFPAEHRHGDLALGAVLGADTTVIRPLASDLGVDRIPVSDLVFLDTETTGLGGGAGCLVFLVGLGYFADPGDARGPSFVVEQHTLVSPSAEKEFLERIQSTLDRFQGVGTFFGKSFDRPRLEDRFAVHQLSAKLPAAPHVDLHTLSRRLWGERLPDCRLRTVEEHVLGFEREDDLPGELCPAAYRAYLDGDPFLLEGVLEHNLNDILSLAVLAHAVCIEAREPSTIRGLISVARGLASGEEPDRAVALLRRALDRERRLANHGGVESGHRAAVALGNLLKRSGRAEEAVRHWREMADHGEAGAYPHLELAKHYEHRAGRLDMALEHTLEAARLVTRRESDALAHRAARLRRKRAAGKGGPVRVDADEGLASGSGTLTSRLGLTALRRKNLDAIADQT